MNQNTEQLLIELTDAFNPFYPLPAGDPQYVDCGEVRGDDNITVELGRNMKIGKHLNKKLNCFMNKLYCMALLNNMQRRSPPTTKP